MTPHTVDLNPPTMVVKKVPNSFKMDKKVVSSVPVVVFRFVEK